MDNPQETKEFLRTGVGSSETTRLTSINLMDEDIVRTITFVIE